MTSTAIVLGLLALAGVCNAAMDSLWHDWSRSVFARWSGGDRTAFWGDPLVADRRRYRNRDKGQGLLPAFRVPILGSVLRWVWDGWHLAQTLMWASLAAAAAVWVAAWWVAPAVWLALLCPFSVAYWLFRRR